jgi:hypothetical protein
MTLTLNNDLTIFVNTSDNFDDCWDPFFKLFKLYWPDCPYPIVLNTELKDYTYEGLNIRCTKVSLDEHKKLSWSECLMRALDVIDSKYILYLQEDYFLEGPVKSDLLIQLLAEMRVRKVCSVVLSGGVGPWNSIDSSLICEVNKNAKWRLSLQAGLWEKSILRSLIRKHETPWQLESYGSYRTKRVKKLFCSVNRKDFIGKGREIIPYSPTGIVAGRWVKDIVQPLFKKHDIYLDLFIRGFHDPSIRNKKRKSTLLRVLDRFRSFF